MPAEISVRKFLMAVFALATTRLACAADLPTPYYTTPAPLSAFGWIGPYIGANATSKRGQLTNNPTQPSGLGGGIRAGYNWYIDQFVWGGARTSVGWTAGFGVEVGFAPRWSAKAEWLYLDLADRTFSVTGTNNGLEANLVRLGVNDHF